LDALITSLGYNQQADTTWEGVYEELTQSLPTDVGEALIAQMQLPPSERHPDFIALNQVMVLAARVFSQADKSADAPPIDTISGQLTALNLIQPYYALLGSISNGSELSNGATAYLASIGPNYPHYDGLNNALGSLGSGLALLQELSNAKLSGGQLPPEAQAAAASAALIFTSLSSQMSQLSPAGDLQIVRTMADTAAMVANSLSLPYTESAPLYLAMSIALTAAETGQSQSGFIGPSFAAAADFITSGIAETALPNANPAGREFLSMLVTLGMVSLAAMGSQAINPGIASYPGLNPAGTVEANTFAFELALNLAVSSGILSNFFAEAVSASGGNAQTSALAGTALGEAGSLVAILSAALQGGQNVENLINSQREFLASGVAAGLELANKTETNNSEQAQAAYIALGQLQDALKESNEEGFVNAYNGFLESNGVTQDNFTADISSMNSTSTNIIGLANDDPGDQPTRGVVFVA
jgi:hypothetical protein